MRRARHASLLIAGALLSLLLIATEWSYGDIVPDISVAPAYDDGTDRAASADPNGEMHDRAVFATDIEALLDSKGGKGA